MNRIEKFMTVTHRCGHDKEYQAGGGATANLRLREEKRHQPCPECKAKGVSAADLPPVG